MAKEEISEEPVRYCLYARKSSEQDKRQALSIDSQIKEMTATAESKGIEVIETIKESYSAKDSRQRPTYMELLQRIRAGEFNGILTWAPDRLSRNAGDLGSLVDLMDQIGMKEKLQEEIDRYHKFTQGVLRLTSEESKLPKVDLKLYTKYILREGKPEEKREVLGDIQNQLNLYNGVVQINR